MVIGGDKRWGGMMDSLLMAVRETLNTYMKNDVLMGDFPGCVIVPDIAFVTFYITGMTDSKAGDRRKCITQVMILKVSHDRYGDILNESIRS
jgi:hypothetical protein